MSVPRDKWYGSERNDAIDECVRECERHEEHLREANPERASEARCIATALRRMKT